MQLSVRCCWHVHGHADWHVSYEAHLDMVGAPAN